MKIYAVFSSLIIIFTLSFYYLFISEGILAAAASEENFEVYENEENESEAEENPYKNYPSYNKKFTYSERSQIWNTISQLPGDNSAAVNQWISIGPYGSQTLWSGGPKYSGRIVDVNLENSQVRVAAASGGLWGYQGIVPVPLSDSIDNLIMGAFTVKPGDPNLIIAGTGEPQNMGGTGLYRTTNGGLSWVKDVSAFFTSPQQFFRLKYSANSRVHAACDMGYYRSDNDGVTWIKKFPVSGNLSVTDVAIDNQNLVYISVIGGGVYRSTNNGDNFTLISNFPVPAAMVGRTSLSLCSGNTNYLYALVANGQNLQGLYRTTDNCVTWQTITPSNWFSGISAQMNYNNAISVNPSNPSIVMAGGVHLFRSTNGGTSWVDYAVPPFPIHDDIHSINWFNASTVYVGCDGGLFVSADAGTTFSSSANTFPISQFYNGACGVNNTTVIIGGTQDNGVMVTASGGNTWNFSLGGDADGLTVDPGNSNNLFATTFSSMVNNKSKSTDRGITWTPMDAGFNNTLAGTSFRNDIVVPVFIYSENGNSVKYSEPPYAEWNIYLGGNFTSPIGNGQLRVSAYSTGGAVVYAPLLISTSPEKLKVNDNGIWYSRADNNWGTDLVFHVSQHPTNNNRAYAIIASALQSRKIYKTYNRGVNWVNITGNLPNVPVTDVLPHPTDTNVIYAGTQTFGCFKTTNSGTNWLRWTSGMPGAVFISEMFYIDSMASRGKFYILAATYGRSMYIREVSGDDPLTGIIPCNITPGIFSLFQNYPNPFNPSTKINFALPGAGDIELKVFDVTGRIIETIFKGYKPAGKYTMDFDGSKYSSGVYFYTLKTKEYTDTKKMILIK